MPLREGAAGHAPGPEGFIRAAPRRARPMTVKDRVGRVRYVAFRVAEGAPVSRGALGGALPPPAKLTRFDGAHGIVRTVHTERERLVAFLQQLDQVSGKPAKIETLTVSGTIRKAAEALPPESAAAKRTPKPRR